MADDLHEMMERARQAQQRHEQKHDVQLEVPGWIDQEDDVHQEPRHHSLDVDHWPDYELLDPSHHADATKEDGA